MWLYLWGLSRSHGCEAVCALGLMPGAYVHCCCLCPPASPKTKLVVSDLCISLPRETNFAEAHKLPGTSTALIHSLSKVELAQTEKEVAQAVHGFGYADPTGQAGWGNYHRLPGLCRTGIHAPCPMGTLESYDGEEGCRVHGGTTAERQVQTLNPNPWLT